VTGPLAEALWPHGVYLAAVILGVSGQKGGRTNYARVQKIYCGSLSKTQTPIAQL
jgi:hypothetical protein